MRTMSKTEILECVNHILDGSLPMNHGPIYEKCYTFCKNFGYEYVVVENDIHLIKRRQQLHNHRSEDGYEINVSINDSNLRIDAFDDRSSKHCYDIIDKDCAIELAHSILNYYDDDNYNHECIFELTTDVLNYNKGEKL